MIAATGRPDCRVVERRTGAGPAGDADDRTLVDAARAGDRDAFAVLYRRHVGTIHAFAWRRLGSRDAAEEVTAATFERALAALPRFRWRGGGFEPWLFRIASNEVVSYVRRRRRWAGAGDGTVVDPTADDPADEAVRAAGAADDATALRRALDTLPPKQQEAIALRYFAGLDNGRAAAVVGCSRGAMAVTVHRATAALRRALGAGPTQEADR